LHITLGEKMPKAKPTWTQKLNDSKNLPKVKVIDEKMSKRWGTGTLVIPAPIEVNEFMRHVPLGKVTTINDIRVALAKRHGATIGCPMTTGIFSWVAAHAAEEQRQNGATDITPYWRTLKTGGLLNEKYPGGAEAQKRNLETEGHVVVKKGKNFFVQNYQAALAQI
jgi:alkylated DNA nucleotide flippase Atl1